MVARRPAGEGKKSESEVLSKFRTRIIGQSRNLTQVKAAVAESLTNNGDSEKKKLTILVAGGGIGGLVFALAAKRKGFEVLVFEKDMSAIRGEGLYRGPIQIQSNALAALEAIDLDVAEEVMRAGCVTGDRINGLVDGISGSWYIKFDTFTPAAEKGLPVTRVISRMTLQQILAHAVGNDIILNDSNVIDFMDHGDKVSVMLENGQCYAGDVLVGADGIWSKMNLLMSWLLCLSSLKLTTRIVHASKLCSYESARRLRVAIIHRMARSAAMMASTYNGYLSVGLGPLLFLTKFPIPHPGRVVRRFFIDLAMPLMLNWVLGGNSSKLEGRSPCCRLSDKASDQLRTWFRDNDALERAMNGEWLLVPSGSETVVSQPIYLSRSDENEPYLIGSESQEDFPRTSIVIPSAQVSKMHAHIRYKDGAFYLIDLRSKHGTYITDNEGRRYRVSPNFPARFRPSNSIQFGSDKKATFRVKVIRSTPKKNSEKEVEGEILQAVQKI
ncbi:hypothetical protein CUMW_125600 [Citrus unshiu]|nr:hypothetical protein CUMW_125600 [Citrus unshiu]